MSWLELAKEKEPELMRAAVTAAIRAMDDHEPYPNKCYGVQLFSDGRVSVKPYSDYGFPVFIANGINVYNVYCKFDKDYVEDIGEGDEAAEIVMRDMPVESKAVMRVFNEKYANDNRKFVFYKNRFFDILSQMFHDEYREYRSAKALEAAKRYVSEHDVMKEIFKKAEEADKEDMINS